MYVSPIPTLLFTGRSTPTTRAISVLSPSLKQFRNAVFGLRNLNRQSAINNPQSSYPCRCLCLGLVQITRTTPLRWMTLQLSHIFLTEALTFISLHPSSGISTGRSLVAVRYAPSVQVVRRKLDEHPVARQNPYEVLAHLARDVR